MGKVHLHTDQFTRTEKYRAWKKVNCHKIYCSRRQPNNMGDCHLNASTDLGTFINSSQGMGFPPKVFIDSDTDQDIPPHIPILEDNCGTCLTKKKPDVPASPCPTGMGNL